MVKRQQKLFCGVMVGLKLGPWQVRFKPQLRFYKAQLLPVWYRDEFGFFYGSNL